MNKIRLFLVGDVMLARAIDMIQPYSCDPKLYEGNGLNANDYVTLAISKNGPLPDLSERGPEYVWGDSIQILEDKKPDLRIINLETSITVGMTPWPRKCVHYKMHPKNISVIQSAKVDCCILANNHTADWGFAGLRETLSTLDTSKLLYAGAGFDDKLASHPAIFQTKSGGRVLVFAVGHESSGVLPEWKAKSDREGLHMINVYEPEKAAQYVKGLVEKFKHNHDIVVLSIHWGGNWGFEIEQYQRNFAHACIKHAGVDVLHGHSSHHVKGIEVFDKKLIIYGAGDFINDYEGIDGYEEFRGDLSLMYFADIDASNGCLHGLEMVPTRLKNLRVNRCTDETDIQWMHRTMERECKKLGCRVKRSGCELKLDL